MILVVNKSMFFSVFFFFVIVGWFVLEMWVVGVVDGGRIICFVS